MNEEIYNVEQSKKNQLEVWAKGMPDFAPKSGICYKCRKQIYEKFVHKNGITTGITVEDAKSLVTGCPHCHRSYCG